MVEHLKNESNWNGGIYQIYPHTFNEVRDTHETHKGQGTLKGITEKRDYLHELGVKGIWISPFYPSPMVDGGYDIADYTGVNPDIGTLEDFDELVSAYHERDMKVMIDLVPNHTSDQHEWFKESRASHDNPKSDWYVWHDGKFNENSERVPPNNWTSVFSIPQLRKENPEGIKVPGTNNTPAVSAWEWDEHRQQYYLRDFAAEQPNLNWHNPEVREAIKEVMRTWLDRGVDGFRVDVANHLGKNPDFTDEAPDPRYKEGIDNPHDQFVQYHSLNYPPTLYPYLRELTSVLDEDTYKNKDLRIILECWMPEEDLTKVNTVSPKASSFNFTRLKAPWEAKTHKAMLDRYHEALTNDTIPNQVLSNHDVPRVATRIGEAAARSAAVLNLTLPGMKFIYNGEEGGFTDTDVPLHRRKDDELGERDGARTPMLWDNGLNAGFSQAHPDSLWLPVDPEYRTKNLTAQKNDPDSFYSLYKALLHLPKFSDALELGIYHPLATDHPDVLAFARRHNSDQSITLVNFSDYSTTPQIMRPQHVLGRKVLSSLQPCLNEEVNVNDPLTLRANEAVVIMPSA